MDARGLSTVLSYLDNDDNDEYLHVYNTYLKSAHVSRISSVLETVLIALHEELEKKPTHKMTGLVIHHSAVCCVLLAF